MGGNQTTVHGQEIHVDKTNFMHVGFEFTVLFGKPDVHNFLYVEIFDNSLSICCTFRLLFSISQWNIIECMVIELLNAYSVKQCGGPKNVF